MSWADDEKIKLEDAKHRNRLHEIEVKTEAGYRQELERRKYSQEIELNSALVESKGRLELEELQQRHREANQHYDLFNYQKRQEIDFLTRQRDRMLDSRREQESFNRRLAELDSIAALDLKKLVTTAIIQKSESKLQHKHSLEQMAAQTELEMLKAEQAHKHRIEEANNASRLNVSEMFSSRFFEYVFSKVGADSAGLSREDLEKMAAEWEKEGDNLKK